MDIQTKLTKVKEENRKIHDDTSKRQERYIERENKYRDQINGMQGQLRVRLGYENNAKVKNEHAKDVLHQDIQDSIENIGPKTDMLKKQQESDITRRFQTALVKMKKHLEEQKTFKNE